MAISNIWSNITSTITNWFKRPDEVAANQKTKRPYRTQVYNDKTESYQANKALTKGLYFNTYPGFKLGAGLVYPIINTPVLFMGLPVVRTVDKIPEIDLVLEKVQRDIFKRHKKIHTECHREGTVYCYPRLNANTNRIEIEVISDDTAKIIKDVNTGELVALITDEELHFTKDMEISLYEKDDTVTVRRIRKFTKNRIDIIYQPINGVMPNYLKDRSARNVLGIIPIPFANNADSDEVRGHSDIERSVNYFKMYHDVLESLCNFQAKFKPKMIQNVDDVEQWLKNNSVTAENPYDVANTDLIFNVKNNNESTEYIFPEGAASEWISSLQLLYKLIIETSNVPEIVMGAKTTGNNNTSEQAMTTFIKFVADKRDEKIGPYKKLYEAILQLLSIRDNRNYDAELKVTWNELSAVSDIERAQILRDFAQGISAIMGKSGITKEQIFNLWNKWFPSETTEDFKDFEKELSNMGRLQQWSNASLEEGNQDRGFDNEIDNL